MATGVLELPKRFETVQRRSAEVMDVDDSNGEVRLRMVPYEREVRLGVDLFEVFERGSFAAAVNAPSRILAWHEHQGPLVGCARSVEDLPDGSYGTFRFSSTQAAQDARTLVVEKILQDVSIEFRAMRKHMSARRGPDGLHVSHARGQLLGAALCGHGVYGEVGAMVLSARDETSDKSHDELIARLRSLNA